MEYRDNGTRFKSYVDWGVRLNAPYDYERQGLIRRLMSNRIVNSPNRILQSVLNFFEGSLVYLMKYVDHLKHFKDYHWKNR